MHTTDLETLMKIARSGELRAARDTGQKDGPLGKPFGTVFTQAVFAPHKNDGSDAANNLQFFPGSRLAVLVFGPELLEGRDFRASAPWTYGRGHVKAGNLAASVSGDKALWREQNEFVFKQGLSLANVREILVHPDRRKQIIADLEKTAAPPPGRTWAQVVVAPRGRHVSSLIHQAVVKDGHRPIKADPKLRHAVKDAFTKQGVDAKVALPSDAERVLAHLPRSIQVRDPFELLDIVQKGTL
jgi:hypothetical protein